MASFETKRSFASTPARADLAFGDSTKKVSGRHQLSLDFTGFLQFNSVMKHMKHGTVIYIYAGQSRSTVLTDQKPLEQILWVS